MKRLVFIIVAMSSLMLGTVTAQDKVLEKSGKQPKWVNGLVKDYIIVVASGDDIQTAQQNALTMVKEQIVLSVAENVKSTTELKRSEVSYNDKVNNFLETFASTTTSQSGKVPFLQGISLSKVEEFYWEKLRRADKSVYFTYHLKYPFPNIELHKLVSEFKQRDRELTKQLEDMLAQVETVTSIEDIEKNIGELKILQDYFMDGRVDQCKLGINTYLELLKSVELVELESNLGELKYYLRIGERTITTSKKPQTKSECARVLSTINGKEGVTVKYNYENCYEDPENNIQVKYRIAGKEISKNFYFDVASNKASIFVTDPIHFVATKTDGDAVGAFDMDITLKSKYDSPFTVQKIVIELEGQAPILIEGLSSGFKGKGNHTLKLNVEQLLSVENTSSKGKKISLLSGYIHFKSDATGEVRSYRIYNHSYTTSW